MGTASSVQMIVVTLWLYFRVYTDSPNRIFADLLARQFPPNFAWVCFAQIHSTCHGHTDKIQRSSILFRTMEIMRDADRRTNRQCSSTWQTVLFIIFIAACPALLIPGAIIRARYEKYKNDFMPLICNIEGSYTEFVDDTDRVSFNVNYTYYGNIGYSSLIYESYTSPLDARIISTNINQYISNITCYWDADNRVPVVRISDRIQFLKSAKSIGLGMLLTGAICFFGAIAIIITEYILRQRAKERNERANADRPANTAPRVNLAGRR
jgi:hypothetical protein